MKKIRFNKILSITLILSFILTVFPINVFANTSVSDTKHYTVTKTDGSGIPLTDSYTKDGLTATLNKKSVSYTVTKTKQVPVYRTDSKTVTVAVAGSSNINNYGNSYSYSDAGGYSGSIGKSGSVYVTGGSASRSKSISGSRSSMSNNLPGSIWYNDGTYSGTMYGQGVWTQTVQTGGSYTPVRYLNEYKGGYFHWQSRDGISNFWSGGKGAQITTKYPNDWCGGSTKYGNPSKPSDFYGRTDSRTHWRIVDQHWVAGNTVVNSTNNDSDSWSGIFLDSRYKDYMRFAYVKYQHFVPASDTRTYGTRYNQNYSGTAWSADTRTYALKYAGTVSRSVIDHYNTVPIEWDAAVVYGGYINYPPTAAFTTPLYCLTGRSITLTNTSSDKDGTIASSTWSVSPSTGVTNNLSSNAGTLAFAINGTYNVTLTVKDNNGKSASTSKTITVYKDTVKPTVTLNVSPNPVDEDQTITYNSKITCPTGIEEYVYTLVNTVTLETHTYTNSIPPTVFENVGLEPGIYQIRLKALGKTVDYGNGIVANGKWSSEVSAMLNVQPSLMINTLTLNSIANPPLGTAAPVSYSVVAPTRIKAGYKLNYILNVKGGDTVIIKLYSNGLPINVQTTGGTKGSIVINKALTQTNVPIEFWFDKNSVKGSVFDMKITLQKPKTDGTIKSLVNNTLGNKYSEIVGSVLEDVSTNQTK